MTAVAPEAPPELAPVVEDMSTYIVGGRQKYVPGKGYEISTGVYSDVIGVREQVMDAERLGFRRVWLSERLNLKETAVILGGAAGMTSRIELASGVMCAMSRPPIVMAAMGATMHAAFGPRFILGLGRGHAGLYQGNGLPEGGYTSYETLVDYATIIKRLWGGETVNYDGPCGKLENLTMVDLPPVAPEIWFAHVGGPVASKIAANPVFDGAMLGDLLNPIATHKSATVSREECERIGRDPASLRIVQSVVTAPELGELETRELVHARIVGILEMTPFGEMYTKLNEWDPEVMNTIRNHPMFKTLTEATADQSYHRSDLLEVTDLLPDEYVTGAAGIGSTQNCVDKVQEFRDAGADEVALYASTPAQNSGVIRAWAARTAGNAKN